MDQTLDLSYLSPDEYRKIQEVMKRDQELKRQEDSRILLKADLQRLRKRGIIRQGAVDQLRTCARCLTELGRFVNRGAQCPHCSKTVCKLCRHYDLGAAEHSNTSTGSQNTWLCIVCHKQSQLKAITGDWMKEYSRIADNRASLRGTSSTSSPIQQQRQQQLYQYQQQQQHTGAGNNPINTITNTTTGSSSSGQPSVSSHPTISRTASSSVTDDISKAIKNTFRQTFLPHHYHNQSSLPHQHQSEPTTTTTVLNNNNQSKPFGHSLDDHNQHHYYHNNNNNETIGAADNHPQPPRTSPVPSISLISNVKSLAKGFIPSRLPPVITAATDPFVSSSSSTPPPRSPKSPKSPLSAGSHRSSTDSKDDGSLATNSPQQQTSPKLPPSPVLKALSQQSPDYVITSDGTVRTTTIPGSSSSHTPPPLLTRTDSPKQTVQFKKVSNRMLESSSSEDEEDEYVDNNLNNNNEDLLEPPLSPLLRCDSAQRSSGSTPSPRTPNSCRILSSIHSNQATAFKFPPSGGSPVHSRPPSYERHSERQSSDEFSTTMSSMRSRSTSSDLCDNDSSCCTTSDPRLTPQPISRSRRVSPLRKQRAIIAEEISGGSGGGVGVGGCGGRDSQRSSLEAEYGSCPSSATFSSAPDSGVADCNYASPPKNFFQAYGSTGSSIRRSSSGGHDDIGGGGGSDMGGQCPLPESGQLGRDASLSESEAVIESATGCVFRKVTVRKRNTDSPQRGGGRSSVSTGAGSGGGQPQQQQQHVSRRQSYDKTTTTSGGMSSSSAPLPSQPATGYASITQLIGVPKQQQPQLGNEDQLLVNSNCQSSTAATVRQQSQPPKPQPIAQIHTYGQHLQLKHQQDNNHQFDSHTDGVLVEINDYYDYYRLNGRSDPSISYTTTYGCCHSDDDDDGVSVQRTCSCNNNEAINCLSCLSHSHEHHRHHYNNPCYRCGQTYPVPNQLSSVPTPTTGAPVVVDESTCSSISRSYYYLYGSLTRCDACDGCERDMACERVAVNSSPPNKQTVPPVRHLRQQQQHYYCPHHHHQQQHLHQQHQQHQCQCTVDNNHSPNRTSSSTGRCCDSSSSSSSSTQSMNTRPTTTTTCTTSAEQQHTCCLCCNSYSRCSSRRHTFPLAKQPNITAILHNQCNQCNYCLAIIVNNNLIETIEKFCVKLIDKSLNSAYSELKRLTTLRIDTKHVDSYVDILLVPDDDDDEAIEPIITTTCADNLTYVEDRNNYSDNDSDYYTNDRKVVLINTTTSSELCNNINNTTNYFNINECHNLRPIPTTTTSALNTNQLLLLSEDSESSLSSIAIAIANNNISETESDLRKHTGAHHNDNDDYSETEEDEEVEEEEEEEQPKTISGLEKYFTQSLEEREIIKVGVGDRQLRRSITTSTTNACPQYANSMSPFADGKDEDNNNEGHHWVDDDTVVELGVDDQHYDSRIDDTDCVSDVEDREMIEHSTTANNNNMFDAGSESSSSSSSESEDTSTADTTVKYTQQQQQQRTVVMNAQYAQYGNPLAYSLHTIAEESCEDSSCSRNSTRPTSPSSHSEVSVDSDHHRKCDAPYAVVVSRASAAAAAAAAESNSDDDGDQQQQQDHHKRQSWSTAVSDDTDSMDSMDEQSSQATATDRPMLGDYDTDAETGGDGHHQSDRYQASSRLEKYFMTGLLGSGAFNYPDDCEFADESDCQSVASEVPAHHYMEPMLVSEAEGSPLTSLEYGVNNGYGSGPAVMDSETDSDRQSPHQFDIDSNVRQIERQIIDSGGGKDNSVVGVISGQPFTSGGSGGGGQQCDAEVQTFMSRLLSHMSTFDNRLLLNGGAADNNSGAPVDRQQQQQHSHQYLHNHPQQQQQQHHQSSPYVQTAQQPQQQPPHETSSSSLPSLRSLESQIARLMEAVSPVPTVVPTVTTTTNANHISSNSPSNSSSTIGSNNSDYGSDTLESDDDTNGSAALVVDKANHYTTSRRSPNNNNNNNRRRSSRNKLDGTASSGGSSSSGGSNVSEDTVYICKQLMQSLKKLTEIAFTDEQAADDDGSGQHHLPPNQQFNNNNNNSDGQTVRPDMTKARAYIRDQIVALMHTVKSSSSTPPLSTSSPVLRENINSKQQQQRQTPFNHNRLIDTTGAGATTVSSGGGCGGDSSGDGSPRISGLSAGSGGGTGSARASGKRIRGQKIKGPPSESGSETTCSASVSIPSYDDSDDHTPTESEISHEMDELFAMIDGQPNNNNSKDTTTFLNETNLISAAAAAAATGRPTSSSDDGDRASLNSWEARISLFGKLQANSDDSESNNNNNKQQPLNIVAAATTADSGDDSPRAPVRQQRRTPSPLTSNSMSAQEVTVNGREVLRNNNTVPTSGHKTVVKIDDTMAGSGGLTNSRTESLSPPPMFDSLKDRSFSSDSVSSIQTVRARTAGYNNTIVSSAGASQSEISSQSDGTQSSSRLAIDEADDQQHQQQLSIVLNKSFNNQTKEKASSEDNLLLANNNNTTAPTAKARTTGGSGGHMSTKSAGNLAELDTNTSNNNNNNRHGFRDTGYYSFLSSEESIKSLDESLQYQTTPNTTTSTTTTSMRSMSMSMTLPHSLRSHRSETIVEELDEELAAASDQQLSDHYHHQQQHQHQQQQQQHYHYLHHQQQLPHQYHYHQQYMYNTIASSRLMAAATNNTNGAHHHLQHHHKRLFTPASGTAAATKCLSYSSPNLSPEDSNSGARNSQTLPANPRGHRQHNRNGVQENTTTTPGARSGQQQQHHPLPSMLAHRARSSFFSTSGVLRKLTALRGDDNVYRASPRRLKDRHRHGLAGKDGKVPQISVSDYSESFSNRGSLASSGGNSGERQESADGGDTEHVFAYHSRSQTSLSSFGARSESLSSVYSAAGGGRFGTVANITGEVLFSISYNYKAGAMEVYIRECRNLAPVDTKRQRSDPYVKVYLLPDRTKSGKRKTKVKKHTLNPVFEEVMKFYMTIGEVETRDLWISVWHSDIFGRNDFLGEVTLPLGHEVFETPGLKWYPLQERVGPRIQPLVLEVCDNQSTYRGDIFLALKYVPKDTLVRRPPPPPPSQPQPPSSPQPPVQHSSGSTTGTGSQTSSPTMSSSHTTKSNGELHVLVKEAHNLLGTRSNGTSDPFCKCYLLPDKSKASKQKTPVMKKTCSPKWNHTFIFDDLSELDLSQRCLELTIWDYDKITSNDFLGGVRLGLGQGKCEGHPCDWMDSIGDEVALWQQMLSRPNMWVYGELHLRPSMQPRLRCQQ
ncbi:uncharacterized protein LOC128956532 isoform X2 [Oppia nitens]|uniref:uncharacterized protein LOC128956532 isoform X2 n=1 Tax=Oppia nitens TaxID=1686743 RepID=UPI0023DA6568|nr:uncharacterized protein LOC128956532 isoform X2 [Oppia nitens]